MSGIGIIIPGSGPGLGPVLPPPLHGYGRTDASHRYVAAKLPGEVGSIVNLWPDEIGSADYAVPSGAISTLTIRSEGEGRRSVAQPLTTVTAPNTQRLERAADLTVRTVIQVFRIPTAAGSGTRNLWQSGNRWRTFVGATNGQPALTVTAGSGGSGIIVRTVGDVGSGIEILGASVDPSNGAGRLAMLGASEGTGTLTLGATGSVDQIFSGDGNALDSGLLEQIEFSSVFTNAEMQVVMAALATEYGI